jgi:hypothetical protein
MATGQTLAKFFPQDNESIASATAAPGLRNGHPILSFDDTTGEQCIFTDILSDYYDGGGLSILIHWAAASATSGTVLWNAAIERIGEGGQNIGSDGFATAVDDGTATAPGTSGLEDVHTITLTSGAEMDSLAAGESYRLKITRDPTGDTMVGDAQIIGIEVRET